MKQSLSFVLLALALLATAGCNSPAKVGVRSDGPQVNADLMLMPADQAHYYAPPGRLDPDPTTTEATPANLSDSVLAPAAVEAHPVARYVDPADKNLMHERHVVYRRAPTRWKLQAPPSQQIIVGPTLSSTQAPTPLYGQEADAFLKQQQNINATHQRAIGALLKAEQIRQQEAARLAAEQAAKKPGAAASTPAPAAPPPAPPPVKAEAETSQNTPSSPTPATTRRRTAAGA